MTHEPQTGMLRWLSLALVLSFLPAVSADEPADQRRAAERYFSQKNESAHVGIFERYPILGVPKIEKAPTIDGTVGQREWFASAQAAHLVEFNSGVQVQDAARLYLAYTDSHLYGAFRLDRPETARAPVPKLDFFEILLDTKHDHATNYNAAFDIEGLLWDGKGKPLIDKSWSATWQYQARINETGWEGEFSVPFRDLGLDGPPATGQVWGLDWVRNEQTPTNRLAVWSFRSDWHDVEDYGHIRFLGRPLAICTEDAGWMSGSSQAGVRLRISNFSDQPILLDGRIEIRRAQQPPTQSYYAGIESAMTEDLPATIGSALTAEVDRALADYAVVERAEPAVEVPASQSRIVELSVDDQPGQYLALYMLQHQKTPMAGAAVPFNVSVPLAIRLESYLFSGKTLAYEIDLRRVQNRMTEPSVMELAVFEEGSGRQVAVKTIDKIHGKEKLEGWLQFEPVPQHAYQVQATIRAGGEVQAQNRVVLGVPARPEWIGNDLGTRVKVPKPFEPVQADRGRTQVWGRVFHWSGSEILPQVEVKGKPVLAEPMRWTLADANGKELPVNVRDWRLAEQDEDVATYRFTGSVGGDQADLSGEVSVELDGFAWYQIRLEPKRPLKLGRASLRIPLKKEFARVYSRGQAYDSKFDEAMPISAPVPAGKVLSSPFRYMFWIGDLEGGMQWFGENNRNWHNADEGEAVFLRPEQDRVTLEINFIDTAVAVAGAIDWAWGIQPTPARPMPEDWEDRLPGFQTVGIPGPIDLAATGVEADRARRAWSEFYLGGGIKEAGVGTFIMHSGWNELFGYPGTYEPAVEERLRNITRLMHSYDIKAVVYAGWGVNTKAPEWPRFGMEMVRLPIKNSGYGTYRQCPGSLFTDFYVYKTAEMIRKYQIDGLFIDSVTSPQECSAPHGCGWHDHRGELRPSYPILKTRKMLRRLYTLVHGELIDGGVIYNHNSPPAIMAIESFQDTRTPSEFAQFHEGPFDEEFLGYFVAKNGGEPFGFYSELTNKDWMRPPRVATQVYAVALPLNVGIKGLRLAVDYVHRDYRLQAEPQPQIWRALQWVDASRSRYLPWWRNCEYVRTSPDKQVIATLWLHPGKKALLSVSNLAKEPRRVQVSLDLQTMGFGPEVKIDDAVLGTAVEHQNGQMSLEIDFERFRLLRIGAQ